MGIPVPPEPDEYGADCPQCFPPGKTPKYVYVFLSGIRTGDGWFDWMPPPPSGTYKVQQLGGCRWGQAFRFYTIHYYAHEPGTLIEVLVPAVATAFGYFDPKSCITKGSSILTEPPNRPWIGGEASVFWKT